MKGKKYLCAEAHATPSRRFGSIHDESQRLQRGNLERFAATDVRALQLVVAADHVGLSLGEARTVALVAASRQLRAFAPHDPGNFVFRCLAALGANEIVRALFRRFVEEFPLIHGAFPRGRISFRALFLCRRA